MCIRDRRLGLWHAVHCDEQIDWLAAHKTQEPHHVFLKMNGGMNRLGFTPVRYRSAWARLNALPQVGEISLMMHFSDADGMRQGVDGIQHQIQAFESATQDLPGERCLSNSAAILRYGQGLPMRNDWVRSGIVMYGSSPDFPEHDIAHWGLLPTMTLSSRLIATQDLQPGDTVGYGSAFVAEQAMRIGIVACGYADGYQRLSPTGTPILVDGVRTRIVGRVSMDMLTVDLTPVPAAAIGSEVTLWGRARNGRILPIDEVARASGTVGYELMCAVAARVALQVD